MRKTVYKSTEKLVNNKKMRYNIIEMEQKINEYKRSRNRKIKGKDDNIKR